MDRFARVVLGYHGCNSPEGIDFAKGLFDGSVAIADWKPSENDYDWLGDGIYFWEHAPERARRWAGPSGLVVGAVIQLGRCFDLTDVRYTTILKEAYDDTDEFYRSQGLEMPRNEGRDRKLRMLDCMIINRLMDFVVQESPAARYQTIRCPFEEGDEVFPGSMLKTETHTQIAVRDTECILGIFRPNI